MILHCTSLSMFSFFFENLMQNLVVVMVDIANNLKVPSLILLYPCLHCINLPLTDQCDDGETTSYNLSIMLLNLTKRLHAGNQALPMNCKQPSNLLGFSLDEYHQTKCSKMTDEFLAGHYH